MFKSSTQRANVDAWSQLAEPGEGVGIGTLRRPKGRRLVAVCVALLAGAGAVAIFRPKPIDVQVTPVVRGKAIDAAYATGTVEALERVDVKARINGAVSQVFVKVGQLVRRGDLLARVANPVAGYELKRGRAQRSAATAHAANDGPQFAALRAFGQAARVELDSAQAELVRVQQLAARDAVPSAELEQARARAMRAQATLEANEAQQVSLRIDLTSNAQRETASVRALASRLEDMNIRAPIDGIVLRKHVEVGDLVVPNQVLFRVGDDSGLVLEVLVDEADVAHVSDGGDGRSASTVAAALYAFPNQVFVGRVFELQPDADRERKAFLAKIRLTSPPAGLRSGMSAEVNIIRRVQDAALLVPLEALDNGNAWVARDGRAELRTVDVGLRDLSRVEIRSGLHENDLVVVSGQAALKDGARVTAELRAPEHSEPLSETTQVARDAR